MQLGRSDVILVMPNASPTVSCPHMFWFETEANRDPVRWDQKMLPEVWNRSLLPMVLLSISMSWNSLRKLELWSHRRVFFPIARSLCFLNAFFQLIATEVSLMLLMYPYGSTTQRKENSITTTSRNNHIFIMSPPWVDHTIEQDFVWGHVLGK